MPRVLVVDDSAMDRRLAGGLLEKNSALEINYAVDGAEALRLIESQPPDLVLTDLQMPELDGLELVGAVRARFPLVPVILMTAHGSEEIAVRALQRGAASYVPKSRLALELLDTVDSVLHMARADRFHDRLAECLIGGHTTFELPTDASLIYPLVEHCQQLVTRMKFCDETGRIRVGIALEEALVNAVYHGNLELTSQQVRESRDQASHGAANLLAERLQQNPYAKRRIFVDLAFSRPEARFTIRDEGPGFDPASVPDPTDPSNLEKECGRGLLLMRTFMDEVQFNSPGNQVTMVKHRDPQQN
jgi:CheY-like chemotaxis protein/anti-sigma regulatory factor (Ser/Thr protein kinase)